MGWTHKISSSPQKTKIGNESPQKRFSPLKPSHLVKDDNPKASGLMIEKFEEGHGWMCNPFGLNIKKNSVMRNKCVFYLLRVIYIIILVILIPILILLFIPCKLAYMVGHATNDAIDNLLTKRIEMMLTCRN